MATTVEATTTTRRAPDKSGQTPWYERYARQLLIGAGAVALVLLGVWFVRESGQRKEAQATSRLTTALAIADRGNLPQAAAELQRLIQTYDGTEAATEAVIALNQVRIASGQGELAVNNLKQFVAKNPPVRYAASAYGLLGSAQENSKRFAEAAQSFEQAAAKAELDFLRASYLVDAGRAYREAGKTQDAIRAYRTVVEKYPDAPAVTEAQVRLGELSAGTM
jgi:outer membrane protein assembly factor BamD (BamD/ComL family)